MLKIDIIKKNWHIILLIAIFLISLYIRIVNVIPDKIVNFDPVWQYRFTSYIVNWGTLPAWDELTYYVGRAIDSSYVTSFMWYIVAAAYFITSKFGMSLLTTTSYMAGLFGALIVIPAYLLGKELSNKYGGLLSAIMIGAAPQILIRTFGGSYDTDQIVLFFLLLTLYLGFYALRKRSIASFCWFTIGFTAFMMTWGVFTYSLFILIGFVLMYLVLGLTIGDRSWLKEGVKKIDFKEKLSHISKEFKGMIIFLIASIAALIGIGFLVRSDVLNAFSFIIGFAQHVEALIVNISIAELQSFNIFNLEGWILSMGRFVIGNAVIDIILFVTFISLIVFGLWRSYKKDLKVTSFLITLFVIGIYTTFKGIRFTEFTSALFIIMIGVGFGYLVEWANKERFLKILAIGLGLCIALVAVSIGLQLGQALGPDDAPNWDAAWTFLKTQTPELSLVGTWWDPGHMIAGWAERRNMADGAHCSPDACMYSINDRITDAGKIMATTNETESIELINKYKGDSPKAYWIASSDLIGKFQWVQYFGTGCDARTSNECPLYYQLPMTNVSRLSEGSIIAGHYGNVIVLFLNKPMPILVNNRNAAFLKEVIYYDTDGNVVTYKLTEDELGNATEFFNPIGEELGIVFTNQTVDLTVWIPKDLSNVVLIPSNLRESVFTKMFMLEGEGLEHFKQVFRNEEVKIYEVV